MNFDRNTVIGFILLAVLFFGMFYFNSKDQASAAKKQQETSKSAQQTKPAPNNADTTVKDSLPPLPATAAFQQAAGEQTTVVENEVLKITFTNKGGQPKMVELKKFKESDSTGLVKLSSSAFDKINYIVVPEQNKTANITDLFFNGSNVTSNADGSKTLTYQLQKQDGSKITHQFVLKKDNYMVDFNVVVNGANQLFSNNTMSIIWQNQALQLQKDLKYEKQMSEVAFNMDGDYDYYNIASRTEKEFNDPVKWVGVKQQFFNTSLVAQKGNFTSGRLEWSAPDSGNSIIKATANLKYALPAGNAATVPLGIYYGPTDYKILKQYGNEMENMVNLGTGIFAFVKYLNRWIILPVFDFFAKLTTNYGIVILLLTLFIRLLISPLTYSSYLSGAKMKVLRPEIEQLKAKHGTDQQAMSMEQMKLFREAGVNPLGGCIPALLQIPIFFALYSFFNSNVALRGQGFLWADDLSVYDSIATLPFNIPFYGDHVSLFTITAVVTSFLISLYSMSMTPDQNNPVLKYMPYVFPVILLFVFNSLPSGLTWYYTVSNLITLALQFVIQNYIINHDKILAKMEENRKKPKTKSKWQERMEQMQEQQKKMKELQQKRK
jgi:YidC/Oxa1 family membrane protein insertase